MSFDNIKRVHTPGCTCQECRKKGNATSRYQNWKGRRKERLEPPHPTGCSCSCCSSKILFETDEIYSYWRLRRQSRASLPVISEIELEINYVFPRGSYSSTPNPVRRFFGMTLQQVLRRKPAHWSTRPAASGRGWVITDEKGNERIRFMRPNPSFKGTDRFWRHIQTGYWVIRDGIGNYLDGDGNVVAPNISPGKMSDDQLFRIHIPFSGIQSELDRP